MKLIDKHLLREYLIPTGYCLCGFCMLYIVAGLFDKASDFMKAGSSLPDVLYYYSNCVIAYADRGNVSFLVTVLPVSLLAGCLYSLSRLTRQNELMAMCAGGVSMVRLLFPFIAVGFAASVISAAVQEFAAPAAQRRLDAFHYRFRGERPAQARIVTDHRIYNQKARRRWQIERYDPARPALLLGVLVKIERPDTSYEKIIRASRAEWKDGKWWFHDKSEQRFLPDNLPDGPADPAQAGPVPMTGFPETPDDFLFAADTDSFERYSHSWQVLAYLGGMDPGPDAAIRAVDAHVRLAMPWACVVATLLAVPAGTKSGRQGALKGILLAVILFLAFYITKEFAVFAGKKQMLHPWISAWISNAVFLVVGTIMAARIRC